jgi:NinB protein
VTNPCIIVRTAADRQRAMKWVAQLPWGGVVEFKDKKRSTEQNAAMWSILTQIARQRPTHNGVKMSAATWKAVFLDALGAEITWLPKLDEPGMFAFGHRSSQLTIAQMTDMIELMLAWTAQNDVTIEHFDDQAVAA